MAPSISGEAIVGKIYSVSCKNFVTYDDVICYPGEYLNVIIGPNGTGKSTLVAAIVLGMGGNPKVLSRSSNIQEYIKNGKQSAYIQVKIIKNRLGTTVAFERTFDLTGKSKFQIDGVGISQKDFLKKVLQYNIQINNLCQFLPQDRVQDFANMNSQDLLNSTQDSVCSQEMIDQLNKLKEFRKFQLNSKTIIADNLRKLKEAEQRNAELKVIIDKMNVRRKFMRKIEICIKKKAWLEYNDINQRLIEIRHELKQAKQFYERDNKAFQEIERKASAIIEFTANLEKIIKIETQKSQQLSDSLNKLDSTFETLEKSIRDAESEFESKKAEEAVRTAELVNANRVFQEMLENLKTALQAVGPEEEYKNKTKFHTEQINECKLKIEELLGQHRYINRDLEDHFQPELVLLKQRISSIENVPERRLNMLKEKFFQTYKAVMWLRQNQHIFESTVYEPMLLELNVKDPKNAKYIENSVNLRDLLAFTCVNKADMSLLVRKLCNEENLQVNVLYSDEATECRFKAKDSIQSLRQYGFYSYLLDMVEGPAPILNYLCRANSIHLILIGTEEVNRHTDNLPPHLRSFYTTNHKFSVSKSKYTQKTSTMRTEIFARQWLCLSVAQNKLNELKAQLYEITKKSDTLKNKRTTIENEITILEEKKNNLNSERKEFEMKRVKVQQCKDHLQIQKRKVEYIKRNFFDPKEEERKFKEFTNEVIYKILEIQQKIVKFTQKYQKSVETHEYNYTKLNICKMENNDIQNEIIDARDARNNTRNLVDTILSKERQYDEKLQSKESHAMELCDGKKQSDPTFPYKSHFNKLPNDIIELQDLLNDLQSRIDCMGAENENIFEDYEQRQKKIESLKEEIKEVTREDSQLETNMTELHNIWYPKIIEIIEIINTNFSRFMASMGYAGEVQLIRNHERDYNDYGIKILVQYRNESKLQALDKFTQSGGERAVAIAVYSLSLQHITNVPFRCVDEINQGMDPRNERKIFEMLVNEVAKSGKSQYFFITPKLLPNLSYNEFMTVHIVFNGKFVQNTNVFIKNQQNN